MLAMEPPKLNTAVVHDFVCSLNKTTNKSMVRVINRLVRKIKSLKSKENDKLLRKAERLVEELHLLKKTHAKEASLFALKNFKTIGEVMSVQRRALIRVASEKMLAEKINDFRRKYPNWKNELPSILSMLGKKWKKNNKIKERIEKSMVKKKKLEAPAKDFSKEKNKSKEKDYLPRSGSPSPSIENMDVNSDQEEEMEEAEAELSIERKEGDLVIKKINLNEQSSDEEGEGSLEEFLDKPLSEGSRKIKDSFFLGGSDDNDNQEESEDDELSSKNGNTAEFNQFNNRFSRRNPGCLKKFSGNSRGFQGGKTKFSDKIHPSWEAKRKARHIAKPIGKKTVFGENEGNYSIKQDLHPSWAAKKEANKSSIQDFKGKRIVFGEKEEPEKQSHKGLHPSWAAKKEANKSSIQEFKGTKIVFDD